MCIQSHCVPTTQCFALFHRPDTKVSGLPSWAVQRQPLKSPPRASGGLLKTGERAAESNATDRPGGSGDILAPGLATVGSGTPPDRAAGQQSDPRKRDSRKPSLCLKRGKGTAGERGVAPVPRRESLAKPATPERFYFQKQIAGDSPLRPTGRKGGEREARGGLTTTPPMGPLAIGQNPI